MATEVVSNGIDLDRLRCSECHCEIHALLNRDLLARHPANSGDAMWANADAVAGFRRRGENEREVHAQEGCDCRCHESARAFLKCAYE